MKGYFTLTPILSLNELEKIPFIDYPPKDGRILYLQPVYLENIGEFKMYAPHTSDKLIEMWCDPIESVFWSKEKVNPETEIYIELIHILANNISFPKVSNLLDSIVNDVRNLGTIIHKQFIIFDYMQNSSQPSFSGRVYKTEVEYFMGLVRSLYDLLYEVLRFLFDHYKICQLPDGLGKIADRDFEEISKKYKFNQPIVSYFGQILPLFKVCRKMRNNIYHHGTEPNIIFETEKGPGVSSDKPPFSEFKDFVWQDEVSQKNMMEKEVASLFYFFNRITTWVLKSTQLFTIALKEAFELPQPISNEYKIYLRGDGIRYLNNLQDYLEDYWIKPTP